MQPDKRTIDFPLLFLIAGLIWVSFFITGIAIVSTHPETMAYLGQFGDMFGILNTAFSGFAMTGAVYAVILQTKQIDEQRKQVEEGKRHDEELMRREKFERLILGLRNISQRSLTWIFKIQESPTQQMATEFSTSMLDASNEPSLLAKLYFPGLDPILEQNVLGSLGKLTEAVRIYGNSDSNADRKTLFSEVTQIAKAMNEENSACIENAVKEMDGYIKTQNYNLSLLLK